MDWLKLAGRRAEIAVSPISRADYARFAQETARPIPSGSGSRAATSPATRVSGEDACAFAAWLSQRDSYAYRLPSLDDMLALADHTHNGGSAEKKPGELRQAAATGDHRTLSEWLDCVPDHGNGRNGLRCIANSSWLRREGGTSLRGALGEGRYSFVTFRLVRTNRSK